MDYSIKCRRVPKMFESFENPLKQVLKTVQTPTPLNQKHPAEAEKLVDYFKQKEEHLSRHSATFVQQATIPERALSSYFLPLITLLGL